MENLKIKLSPVSEFITGASEGVPETDKDILKMRHTASYAHGVALCPTLTRRASAPHARPEKRNNLPCGVRKASASRLRRRARYTAPYVFTAIFALAALCGGSVYAEPPKAEPSVKQLSDDYKKNTDNNTRRAILKRFQTMKVRTQDDVVQLRGIFADKKWDEDLFSYSSGLVAKIDKPEMSGQLILILKDEKELIGKLNQNDLSGKTEREAKYRFVNAERVIRKLGALKSKEAVPVLKEYLAFKNMQYAASEALGEIGDKSMSEPIREKAYKGEEINYGGMGIDEAKQVVQDLEDKGKKDKWPKIAKQIILIKNPGAKPYLKKLFNHELSHVRGEAASRFGAMADIGDVNDILEMAINPDWAVRCSAIDAMKHLKEHDFTEVLLTLLKDKESIVRLYAAKALGYKKVISAVPHLEETLKDNNIRVRQESYIALYVLTGKKYDFNGKNTLVERRAEHEKDHPSFY